MAIKINLILPELAAGRGILKIARVAKSLNLILLSGFLVFGLGLAGFFIASSVQLENLTARGSELKDEITSFQTTEQKIVLLKDRIEKIKTAKTSTGIDAGLTAVSPILLQVSGDSTLGELAIDSQRVELSINLRSQIALANFLTNVKASTLFKSVVLTSFGFNPTSGYQVALRLLPK